MMPNYVPQWYVWVIGILLPIVVQLLTQKDWARWKKSLVAFGVAVLAGLGAVWASGKFDVGNALATIGLIFTLSQLFYDQFFKNVFKK
ncbi:MAG: hypothetical protein J7L03_01830 [Caldisericaceae bacterium]|nr:hypothetical protein [Caldisericaceae bacterium]